MKVATWNINSVRARFDRLLAWLKAHQPDVLCLQEIKVTDEQFPTLELQALGYHAAVFGQKSYNGVAILSKEPLTKVERNLGDGDEQARLIAGTYRDVHVVGLYAPNGQGLESPAYQYKLEWYGRLARWLKAKYPTGPLLVCGDFNVAPLDLDVWDLRLWQGQTLFSPKEKEVFKGLVDANQLVDLFRVKHPGEQGLFSWWDYRAGAFKKNWGLRIDHLLVNAPLVARCTKIEIDRQAREGQLPSDHAPVWAEFHD